MVMTNRLNNIFDKSLFLPALLLIIYMPLHVFIAQSASLVTGGIEVWKAAKDILVVLLVPFLLYAAYKKKVFSGHFRWHLALGCSYVLLHLLFVLFDQNDHTLSAITASVYNSRLLAYLLLGIVVARYLDAQKKKILLTVAVLIATAVAMFGIAQYFLPHDLLTNVGYSLERGVKPLFFIDDKPDLPRVMSTLRDPNSLGAYLIFPLLLVGLALFKKDANKELFARPFRQGTLVAMSAIMFGALFLTFSRGAAIGLVLGIVTLLYIVTGQRAVGYLKRYWQVILIGIVIVSSFLFIFRNTYFFQNVFFHADQSTVLADPNELRVSLTQEAVVEIVEQPLGYGPGTAGLVSISNPQGGKLTENYYLQIAHEVGWLGIALFLAMFIAIMIRLLRFSRNSPLAATLFASGIAYAFYSLLIHLWSNEAVAFQWWFFCGLYLSTLAEVPVRKVRNSIV